MNEMPAQNMFAREDKKIPVMEIFGPTVQGEGVVCGQRTFFIRFGGCDYRCKMCDSMHAVDPLTIHNTATWSTQTEIAVEMETRFKQHNCRWVTLSGGNPAIHNLLELCTHLKEIGFGISVETQGTMAPAWLGMCDYITVSPKGPGMGEKFEAVKFMTLMDTFKSHPGLSVKVVIFSAIDLEFASAVAEMVPDIVNTDRFYLSHGNPFPPKLDGSVQDGSGEPGWNPLMDSIFRYKMMLVEIDHYPALKSVRFLPQLHHWLWGNERGR